jgi:4-oxalocrotonate tautomerase
MPHVIIKMWPGKSEQQKTRMIEEVEPGEWTEKVYRPDILGAPGKLYKKPGYNPL